MFPIYNSDYFDGTTIQIYMEYNKLSPGKKKLGTNKLTLWAPIIMKWAPEKINRPQKISVWAPVK